MKDATVCGLDSEAHFYHPTTGRIELGKVVRIPDDLTRVIERDGLRYTVHLADIDTTIKAPSKNGPIFLSREDAKPLEDLWGMGYEAAKAWLERVKAGVFAGEKELDDTPDHWLFKAPDEQGG